MFTLIFSPFHMACFILLDWEPGKKTISLTGNCAYECEKHQCLQHMPNSQIRYRDSLVNLGCPSAYLCLAERWQKLWMSDTVSELPWQRIFLHVLSNKQFIERGIHYTWLKPHQNSINTEHETKNQGAVIHLRGCSKKLREGNTTSSQTSLSS